MSADDLSPDLDRLITQRLRNRTRVANDDRFDAVHRQLILDEELLHNRMYQRLVGGDLQDEQTRIFLSEYYHGSISGFLKTVMPVALKAHPSPLWSDYIKQIRIEESTPKNHAVLFEEFLESVGMSVQEPVKPSLDFVEASKVGYSKNLPYSCGYALAVEVEADYQIAVVAEFAKAAFGADSVYGNVWFDAHLDETGEEEHAKQTVSMSEAVVRSDGEYREFVRGFKQSCSDTKSYMDSIFNLLFA